MLAGAFASAAALAAFGAVRSCGGISHAGSVPAGVSSQSETSSRPSIGRPGSRKIAGPKRVGVHASTRSTASGRRSVFSRREGIDAHAESAASLRITSTKVENPPRTPHQKPFGRIAGGGVEIGKPAASAWKCCSTRPYHHPGSGACEL